MSLAVAKAIALTGVSGHLVSVEAEVGQGLPQFKLVGLPDTSLTEAVVRVRAACAAQRLSLQQDRVTVNLSPAELPKSGSSFDLAIAMAALAAKNMLDKHKVCRTVFIGELGLHGTLRPVLGVLPAVVAAVKAGMPYVVVPEANRQEAELVPDAHIMAAETLTDVIARFAEVNVQVPTAQTRIDSDEPPPVLPIPQPPALDMADVRGQEEARFGAEVAAAGGHHLLMVGSPGAGKTMLAQRLPGILPDLEERTALEVTAVQSISHRLPISGGLWTRPPFESPHHTASAAAIIGGGTSKVIPGAVTRAHHGVLFLDEAPEFATNVLQALRQPLESGEVTIARSKQCVTLPARFQLVLAANPCPCGRALEATGGCECPAVAKRRYLGRICGPLLDRVDVRVVVQTVHRVQLSSGDPSETTDAVAQRVRSARAMQRERLQPLGCALNAAVPGAVLRGALRLPGRVRAGLDAAMDRGAVTARGYDRTLRLAWTVADLDGADSPGVEHLGLAMSLRGNGLAV